MANQEISYELVIGLEVHAQLQTKSKLFCSDSTAFGAEPNTQVSPVSLAHPGTLPVMNKKAIELAVKLGVALQCDIEKNNYFARKNYFYPDLPKGYQISQHTAPVCRNGFIDIETSTGEKHVVLNRIHLEEDAGKSIHDADPNFTCIDLNRAGVPLLEIVTEPCMHNAEEAFIFLTELRRIVRWLEVCDGNMEEGSMRCDANISVRPVGSQILGTRVEVKNLNSIRNVKKAIEIEGERLISLERNNERIIQETRSFDADTNTTFSLRSKEEAEDYRYFPEPDLPPFHITENYIREIKDSLPLLPKQLKQELMDVYGLSEYDASQVSIEKEDVVYFKQLTELSVSSKAAANWMTGPLKYYCNEHNLMLSELPLAPEKMAALIQLSESGKVSFSNASTKILQQLLQQPEDPPLKIAETLNLIQDADGSAVEQWIDEVIMSMPDKVKEYKSGKKGLIGLFAGEVKKRSKGKADMKIVNEILAQKLN